MSDISDTKRLADALNALALTMTEIMMERLRAATDLQEHKIANQLIDPMLTKKELAVRLHITVRTVDNWMKRGLLPHVKIGRCVRFRWTEVQHQLERLAVCRWR